MLDVVSRPRRRLGRCRGYLEFPSRDKLERPERQFRTSRLKEADNCSRQECSPARRPEPWLRRNSCRNSNNRTSSNNLLHPNNSEEVSSSSDAVQVAQNSIGLAISLISSRRMLKLEQRLLNQLTESPSLHYRDG